MKRIGGIEGKILREYSEGLEVKSQDKLYLERMAITGLVKYGYDIDKMTQTAKTTLLGRSVME